MIEIKTTGLASRWQTVIAPSFIVTGQTLFA
jgi:hypothetical protein